MSKKIEHQIEALLDALRQSEQEEKQRYNAAIDIENIAEATAVTIDARTKIQQLRKWTEEILSVQKEYCASLFQTKAYTGDEPATISIKDTTEMKTPAIEQMAVDASPQAGTGIADGIHHKDEVVEHGGQLVLQVVADISGEVKIGRYIRNKLYELSQSGYIPFNEEVYNWQSKEWSKRVLNLNYVFARVYIDGLPMSEQISTNHGANRYWAEVFEFGSLKLLFCSQWYKDDREYFDKWYNRLMVEEVIAKDTDAIGKDVSDVVAPNNPVEFSLFGATYEWSSWNNVLIDLCEILILQKPYDVLGIGVNKSIEMNGQCVLWYSEHDEDEQSHKLSNGLSLNMNLTDNEVFTCCGYMLDLCGYGRDELAFS